MKKTITLVAILIVIVLAGIRLKSNRDRIVNQRENLSVDFVSVSVVHVERKTCSFTINMTGTLYPFKELDIPAETAGKITALHFDLGQRFEKGGVIAAIDDQIKKLTYESAKLEADRLRKDWERTENLYQGGTASEQQLDNARTAYETAKNQLNDAAQQLAYTTVTTPIAGTITRKIVEQGTYVKAGDPIASIVDVSRLKVKVNVSEANVYELRVGDNVKITTDVYRGVVFDGKIRFVSPRGDESHNYPVEIEIANSAKTPLKAGTFVNVEVKAGSDNQGLFIPREALQGSIKDAKVYIAENGKAMLKTIVIGRESNESLEVLSGLGENDQVIVSGQVNLIDNRPIKIIDNH